MPSENHINLALQGGGAHGAFAWGVLDKLCEDGRLTVDGISATSAGAMNAAVFAYGQLKGGNEGARAALEAFWRDVSHAGSLINPVKQLPWESWLGGVEMLHHSFSYMWFDSFTKLFSPYQFNPFNINPLASILRKHVDFDAFCDSDCTRLFIAATNVKTNRLKIFKNKEVTADAVLASACLPMLFQAVEIDDEPYWDGGYMGNPALFPLAIDTDTKDIVIVHINPVEREALPRYAPDIVNRVNEISFNSSLMRELRALKRMIDLADQGFIKEEKLAEYPFAKLNLHSIRADESISQFSIASKFSSNWDFLKKLRDLGREVTATWLQEKMTCVGHSCTLNWQQELNLGEDIT